MNNHVELVRSVIPLWYESISWAKKLLVNGFNLQSAEDILVCQRGRKQIPGTEWFMRTHGVGVDIYRAENVGGIDFDFDKPDPDPWRLAIFIEKQINDGKLPYEPFKELLEDDRLMKDATRIALDHA